MLPMRLMTALQASMASLSMVLPEAACPTMAKLRISGGWSIFIPKCVFRVRPHYRGAGGKGQIFLREVRATKGIWWSATNPKLRQERHVGRIARRRAYFTAARQTRCPANSRLRKAGLSRRRKITLWEAGCYRHAAPDGA